MSRGVIDQAASYIADSADGTTYSKTQGSINLTAGNVVNATYVDLPAGVFAIHARMTFSSTSASSSWTEISIGTSSSAYTESAIRIYQQSSYWNHMATSYTVKLTQATRIYVKGGCSIARNGCTANIYAIKLWGTT